MIQGLADFSAAIANLVANAASLVGAVRIGPNRHITGLHWRNDTIMTVDQALPVQDNYSVILAAGSLVAGRRGPRDLRLRSFGGTLADGVRQHDGRAAGARPHGLPRVD